MACPTFRRVKGMAREEAVAALALPATKAAMLAEFEEHAPRQLKSFVRSRPLFRWHPSYELCPRLPRAASRAAQPA